MKNLTKIVQNSIRFKTDKTINSKNEIFSTLYGARKEDALMIANRIQKAFRAYLLKGNFDKEAGFVFKIATFPNDGDTFDELMKAMEANQNLL